MSPTIFALLELARFHVCPRAIRDSQAMAHITYLQAHGPVETPATLPTSRGATAKETRDDHKHIA